MIELLKNEYFNQKVTNESNANYTYIRLSSYIYKNDPTSQEH